MSFLWKLAPNGGSNGTSKVTGANTQFTGCSRRYMYLSCSRYLGLATRDPGWELNCVSINIYHLPELSGSVGKSVWPAFWRPRFESWLDLNVFFYFCIYSHTLTHTCSLTHPSHTFTHTPSPHPHSHILTHPHSHTPHSHTPSLPHPSHTFTHTSSPHTLTPTSSHTLHTPHTPSPHTLTPTSSTPSSHTPHSHTLTHPHSHTPHTHYRTKS